MTQKEQLITWLRDAHAMETGIVPTLEKHAADAKDLPKVRAAIKKHLAETKRHVNDVQKCLFMLGAETSTIKTGMAKIGGLIGGIPTSFVKDTPVKNGIADYATEHFEIACYTSLVATAGKLGETKVAALCEGILKDEVAMALQLETLNKAVNASYLATLEKENAPASAPKPARPASTKKAAAKPAPSRSKSKPTSKKKS